MNKVTLPLLLALVLLGNGLRSVISSTVFVANLSDYRIAAWGGFAIALSVTVDDCTVFVTVPDDSDVLDSKRCSLWTGSNVLDGPSRCHA